eukprot:6053638-Lingulodinium_polyedra.AAC.1
MGKRKTAPMPKVGQRHNKSSESQSKGQVAPPCVPFSKKLPQSIVGPAGSTAMPTGVLWRVVEASSA